MPNPAIPKRARIWNGYAAIHGYSHNTCQTSTSSAREINAEYVRLIYLTSPLHDIGKVGIPDCVLLKPGRLNDREFEIMKTHADFGAQTLDAALRQFPGVKFLQMGRDIAASHHERFDGTGYPQGLGGESIPLCAELSLLPMYTMLLRRSEYTRRRITHDIARSMIVQEAGAHFDPDVVDAFLQTEARFVSIRAQFAEPQALAA